MAAKSHDVLLGYEIGSGEPVSIPFAHSVCCGMTQSSGKTTTLEALIARSDRKAIAFITKRAEGVFARGARIPPFFADNAGWQFVESILEATMRQKMKFERAWIMRVCEGARTLEQVHENTRAAIDGIPETDAMGRPKAGKWKRRPATGMNADIYLQLNEYFKLLLPELRRLRMAMPDGPRRLELAPGLNVMDLGQFSTEMQSLVIASTMEKVYGMEGKITTVVPESWEFVPEGRNTPVKLAAIALVRKGLAGGKLMYFDSQEITSVDKKLLKQAGVWILGVQREINEVEHTIDQIPVPKRLRPKPEDVMQLRRGQFFVCYEDVVKRVYVQPAWMSAANARAIATLDWDAAQQLMREAAVDAAEYETLSVLTEEEDVADQKLIFENDRLRKECGNLRQQVLDLKLQLGEFAGQPETESAEVETYAAPSVPATPDVLLGDGGNMEQLYEWMRAKLLADTGVLLAIKALRPQLEITVARHIIKTDQNLLRGRVGMMIRDGFFTKGRAGTAVLKELHSRGFKVAKMTVYDEMDRLAEMGFFRKEKQADRSIHFVLVDGMDVRVVEHNAA